MTKTFALLLTIFFSYSAYAEESIININNGNSVNQSNIGMLKSKEATINGSKIDNVYIVPTPDVSHVFDNTALFWLSKISPQKISYPEIQSKINEYNKSSNSKWRLPTFFEIERASKNKEVLGNFQGEEVWVKSEASYPSFDLNIGERYSGENFKNDRYSLLLVKDL